MLADALARQLELAARLAGGRDNDHLRALYDKAGRAVESGDAAGTYSFNYSSTEAVVSPRTVITDPAGAKMVFAHTSKGALSEASDEEGEQ